MIDSVRLVLLSITCNEGTTVNYGRIEKAEGADLLKKKLFLSLYQYCHFKTKYKLNLFICVIKHPMVRESRLTTLLLKLMSCLT